MEWYEKYSPIISIVMERIGGNNLHFQIWLNMPINDVRMGAKPNM